jgi:hypothetical protein
MRRTAQAPIAFDKEGILSSASKLSRRPLAELQNGLVRHNPERLAREIMRIYGRKAPTRLYSR